MAVDAAKPFIFRTIFTGIYTFTIFFFRGVKSLDCSRQANGIKPIKVKNRSAS